MSLTSISMWMPSHVCKAARPRGHGEPNTYRLPTGPALRAILEETFLRQRRVWRRYLRQLARGERAISKGAAPPPSVEADTPDLARRAMPVLTEIIRSGERRLAAAVGTRPIQRVTNEHVIQAAERAAYDFSATTNATTSRQLDEALAALRQEMSTGMQRGEAIARLTKRVEAIFDHASRSRARTIARTEAMRASNQGLVLAGEASGVVYGWRWLLSAGACEVCMDIQRSMPEIPLGGVFGQIGDHPTYSIIRHPPAHPNCTCTVVAVLVPRSYAVGPVPALASVPSPAPAPEPKPDARQVVSSVADVVDLAGDVSQVVGTARQTIGRIQAGESVTVADLFDLGRQVADTVSGARETVGGLATGDTGAPSTVSAVVDAVRTAQTFRVDPRLRQPELPRVPGEPYDERNGRAVRIRTDERTYYANTEGYDTAKRGIEAIIQRVTGRPITLDQALDICGIPRGRIAVVYHDDIDDQIQALTDDDRLTLRCQLKNKRLEIDQFYSKIGNGFGIKTFLGMVESARKAGLERITLTAAGSAEGRATGRAGVGSENGYYTWPLFGFDAPIPDRVLDAARAALGNVSRLSDLMRTEVGRAWWKNNGVMVRCAFDLADESESMRQLQRYQEERLKRLGNG